MNVCYQSEAAECGLACLAMVASHHGHSMNLRDMRRRFPLSLKGANLDRLISAASDLGFQGRALRLEVSELDQLTTPCILHWDLCHYVVLERVRGETITVIDPSTGRRTWRLEEVSTHFTGVALELSPSVPFKPERSAAPAVNIRQLTGRIRGLRRSLALILALSVALQFFVLVAPFYLQWVVDHALVTADRNLLAVLGWGFCLALLLQVASGVLRGWAIVHLSSRLGFQWLANVFAHLLRLPLDFFEKRHLGNITSRMGSVQSIQNVLTTSFVEALVDGLTALLTLIMMMLYSWTLALVTLAAVLFYLLLRSVAYFPLRTATEQQLEAAAHQESHLLESIRGIQSVKVAGTEAFRRSAYLNLMQRTVNREVVLARLGLGFGSANELIFGIERVAVIWIGASLALDNVFSVGMLIAYLAYKDQFALRVAGLIDKWVEFRMLRLHGERLADITLTEPEQGFDRPQPAGAPQRATLDVSGLCFRYAPSEPWVLRNCAFNIEDGESVAIVGPSGCGKTTLIKTLLGLLPASEGVIKVDGIDLSTLGARNFRRWTGVVMQDDQLFAGSIAENIAFGDEGYDSGRVEAAARMAAVHDEIVAMPMGYHSLIGDMGTTLSGGQKQRVILARALYRQPSFLFLDEATSHLDVDRESLVNAAVRGLRITRVIVAHRPETIASVDRVLLLKDGAITEVRRRDSFSVPPAGPA